MVSEGSEITQVIISKKWEILTHLALVSKDQGEFHFVHTSALGIIAVLGTQCTLWSPQPHATKMVSPKATRSEGSKGSSRGDVGRKQHICYR